MYTAEKISKILDISLNEFSELTKKILIDYYLEI